MPTATKLWNPQRLFEMAEKRVCDELATGLVTASQGLAAGEFATEAHTQISRARERIAAIAAAIEASK